MKSSLSTRSPLAIFEYDFAVDGGETGTIILFPGRLPAGAIVLDGLIHVVTAVTSDGSATVALHINTSEDVLTASAGAKANLTEDALIDVVPVCSAATAQICATAKGLSMVIGTAALTAGKFVVALRYIETE